MIKKHQFEVPQAMVRRELEGMFESFVHELSNRGKKLEDSGITVEQFVERYKPMATDRVRGYLILDAIAKAENIVVEDADLEARFANLATYYKQTPQTIRESYEKKNLIDGLKLQSLNEKTLDFIVSKAKIKKVKVKKEGK